MTSSGEIMEFDGAQWTLHAMNGPLEGMVQDAQGSVWAGTDGDGLYRRNGSSWRHWPQLDGTVTISGVGKDKDGVAYIST